MIPEAAVEAAHEVDPGVVRALRQLQVPDLRSVGIQRYGVGHMESWRRQVIPEATVKLCASCGESKPLAEFGMKGHLTRSYCIPCDKDYKKDHKARVLLSPERKRAWQDSVNEAQDKNQKATRSKATEHYGSWTESDDAFLRANWNMPRKEVALHLGRTYAAVATRKLKLKKLSERTQP